MQNVKIIGDRVLLKDVPEETELNGILLPDSKLKQHCAFKVVAVGDGKIRGTDTPIQRKICVSVGDTVFVQVHPMMRANAFQAINGEKHIAVNSHDIIAKIGTGVASMTVDSFTPVGRWLLIRVEQPEKAGEIYLPGGDKVGGDTAGEVKLFVEKLGEIAAAETEIAPGSRVMLEHTRATPLKIQKQLYAYIDLSFVVGSVDTGAGDCGPPNFCPDCEDGHSPKSAESFAPLVVVDSKLRFGFLLLERIRAALWKEGTP